MSAFRRSTTGCTLCKIRRKKCDETKPQCLRCLGAGRSCSYDYVEYPESEGHRVKRTKLVLGKTSELTSAESQTVSAGPHAAAITPSFIPPGSGSSLQLIFSVPPGASSQDIHSSSGVVVPRGTGESLSLPSISSVLSQRYSEISLVNSSLTSGLIQPPAGAQHTYDIIPATGSAPQVFPKPDPDDDGTNDDNDPEGIRVLLCLAPTLDKNVKENSLPFVLQCYSQWAIAIIFEPRRMIHAMRDQVIARFTSENTRTKAILMANVMNMFVKGFAINRARSSILNQLALDVQKSGAAFMATPPSFVPAVDRQNAIRTLDSVLEILTLQLDTQSAHDCVESIENAAPIFRRACLEPPGRPVNLSNILLDLSLNLRYFATLDIIKIVTTGLPASVEYEVPFSHELCERVYCWQLQGHYGLQWLYGFPDQFILLIAWINSLSNKPEACENAGLVGWIEELLPQIRIAIDELGDPALRIGRMVVLESWRIAVLIYLYMVLCKADAHDPRVIRAQKSYMRLISAVKRGRTTDLYLVISMNIAGVATTKERDRNEIRQRILGVREYADRGTAGNDILLRLEDIWARTRDEGRAAVWSDLRIAFKRVTVE